MPAPWVGGAQVRIVGSLHGSETNNVFNLATNDNINDPGTLDTILLALAQAMLDCAITTLLPAVTQDWTLVRCEARRIWPTPSDPIIATAPANSVGALGVTSVSFAASLVHLRSGVGGRRGRGRVFLPPPGEAQIAQSGIDGPTLALITDFLLCVAAKFMGAAPTTPWRLGVFSRKTYSGVGGTFDNSFFVVSSLNPVARLAVMSSRKQGSGS